MFIHYKWFPLWNNKVRAINTLNPLQFYTAYGFVMQIAIMKPL